MNFLEAVKAMKEGKKVRRNIWKPELFCEQGYPHIYCAEANKYGILFNNDFLATDWEVLDEDKDWNLSLIHI